MTMRPLLLAAIAATLVFPFAANDASAQKKATQECTPVKPGSPAAKSGQKCMPKAQPEKRK